MISQSTQAHTPSLVHEDTHLLGFPVPPAGAGLARLL